jgi:hypothetical protein
MGVLRNAIDGDGRDPLGTPANGADAGVAAPPSAPPVDAAAQPAADSSREQARSELQRRRDALAEIVTELHWDLGGLAYEMAIRDHFRLDVLVRRAALLQERDAELAELERLLRMEQEGVAGSCPNCAAPHSRGALYCWQCGATLMQRLPSVSAGEPGEATRSMDALLAAQPGAFPEPAPGSDG